MARTAHFCGRQINFYGNQYFYSIDIHHLIHDQKMKDHKKLESQRTIHERGVTYVHDLLDRVGFTIHDVNKDPDHHYQIFAQFKDRAMLIAVRTAYHPDVGKMDNSTREKLIYESKKLNAVPHFAGLSLTVENKSDIQREESNQIAENNIVFYGISVVR